MHTNLIFYQKAKKNVATVMELLHRENWYHYFILLFVNN